MSSTTSQPLDVSAGLVFRAGRLLITQRHPGGHLGGLWEFPGGKRQPGESDEDCLIRELREELGIEVKIGELLETIEHAYPEKTVRLKFFRCEWKLHEPRKLDCHDFAWINREQLAAYAFPEADARLLERLSSTPELWDPGLGGHEIPRRRGDAEKETRTPP